MADHKDWEKLDGKLIRIIYLMNQPHEVCPYVDVSDGKTLELSAIYMGDRTEVWVIEKKNGEERGRYNSRAIESIHWLNGDVGGSGKP